MIEEYKDILEKSIKEDELIEEKKETSAKINFKITKEEIMR